MNINDKTKCKVPFGTMSIDPRAIQLINTQLATTMVTNGKCVKEFEKQFAKAMKKKYAVAVSSGTDADTLALACLHAHGGKRGISEVIIPALTFISTANAVLNAGFKPVFVDVRRDTMNIDVNKLQEAITRNTIAIMPVHLMGKPADMDAITKIAERNDLFVIEDAAEAHGAKYKGKLVGSFGHMACYSLYSAHIISSIEGGMVTTDHEDFRDALVSLRNHGVEMDGSNWTFNRVGYNAKMNELEAAVGLYNVEQFRHTLTTRHFNLQYLMQKFDKFGEYFDLFIEQPYERIGPHAYPIVVKENAPFTKKELVDWYTKNGIDNRNLFYSIPSQCEAYQDYRGQYGDFENAEHLSDYGTHVGVHQGLSTEQLDYVYDKTHEFLMRVV